MSAGPTSRSGSLASRLPDTYLLIAAVGLLVFLAGFIFSPGRFELQTVTLADGNVTQRVDPETFRYVEEAERGTLFASDDEGRGLFNAVYEGLVSGSRTGGAVAIIAFILLTGGAFGVIMATGTIDRALGQLIGERTRDPRLMLAALFAAFSLGGAGFGISHDCGNPLRYRRRRIGHRPDNGRLRAEHLLQVRQGNARGNADEKRCAIAHGFQSRQSFGHHLRFDGDQRDGRVCGQITSDMHALLFQPVRRMRINDKHRFRRQPVAQPACQHGRAHVATPQ